MSRSTPFNGHELNFLQDPEQVALYLEESYAEGGEEQFQIALKTVAKAQEGGVKGVAANAGLNRENLYRALSKGGNPQSKTIKKMLDALGIEVQMRFVPKEAAHV
ncbi:MAG: putative addiction module antidote protein [Marinovum sp.]|nr:putative addiction module antidote protein [Marinovum sp.]|tara:strand:- start:309 stop:623 length:315 start_codon:yes stop_codon:yes gene_type:complete